MDVTCERCGTEYDFDETLVSERGTTVKCTNCGHLFKVWKKGAPASADATARPWLVRRNGGPVETIATLRDLQKRITEGALTTEDEISRSGEGWKKLGTIAELDTFFAAARASAHPSAMPRNDSAFSLAPRPPFSHSPSNRPPSLKSSDPSAHASTIIDDMRGFQIPKAPRPPSMDTGKQTVMGVGPASTPPPSRPPRSVPPPPPAGAKGTLLGMSAPPLTPSPQLPKPSRPPPPTAEMQTFDDAASTGMERPSRKTKQNAPPQAASPGRAFVRPVLIEEEDRTEMQPRRKRSGGPRWVTALFTALILGGLFAFAWLKLRPNPNAANADARARILHDGDVRLLDDDDTAYNDAILIYARVQAFDANDAQALASISRVHALWAQALNFDADDLEARAADDAAARAVATRVRRESSMHATEAKRYADLAMRALPSATAARLAAADAARLSGDSASARSTYSLAGGDGPNASAEALRVGALIAMDRAAHQVAQARTLAERAVQKDPAFVPARILLARALLAEGNIAAARAAVDAVLAEHPQHARAQALKEAMDRGIPPAAPVVATNDGGVADAAMGGASSAVEPVPAGRDYDFYVTQGETFLASHANHRARAFFEAALQQRPNDARAKNGLGFIALNAHDYASAAREFETAADAGSAEAMIGLGEAYRRLRRDGDALRTYQRYLQRGGPDAAIARHWVEVLTETLHGPGATPPPLDAPSPQPVTPAPPPDPEPVDIAPPIPAPTPSAIPSETAVQTP
jgi:predicted Zn finger-like uncharacterized protein